jgi:nitronate monooxygenase
VSNAGGLGSLGVGYLNPDEIRAAILSTRALTTKPFAVNLFIPTDRTPAPNDLEKTLKLLDEFREQLNIPRRPTIADYADWFAAQIEVVLAENITHFSFTFGIPGFSIFNQLKRNDVILMGTATTVAEGKLLAENGCDIVIAQGYEAGGHRGTFAGDVRTSLIGTMALVPQLVDAIDLPVIAAGGIMDGRGLAAAMVLGASAVQMGTAFLTCSESGLSENARREILRSTEESTVITTAFSGRPVRTIKNDLVEKIENAALALPDYPLLNNLTADIRAAASQQNRPEWMSIYAGQGTRLNKEKTAAVFIDETVNQALLLLPHAEF